MDKKHKKIFYLALIGVTSVTLFGLILSIVTLHLHRSHSHDDPQPKIIQPWVVDGDLTIHFLELGNQYVGDSIYINYGEWDILIDAGSKSNSAAAIKTHIDQYMTDGILEYVIATHAHEDHIAAFYSSGSGANRTIGIFDAYEVGTVIDFGDSTNKTDPTSGSVINRYREARDKAIERDGGTYIPATTLFNQISPHAPIPVPHSPITPIDSVNPVFQLTEKLSITILYNYYFFNKSSEENNYSVSILVKYGEQKYLFTGDLEAEAEHKMLEYYSSAGPGDANILKDVTIYKGAHHGSNTSSSEEFMSVIRPKFVAICSCAGTTEYTNFAGGQFPTQNFIERIAPYTDKVYVTTLMINFSTTNENARFEPMNGTIVFSIVGDRIAVHGSNNDTILKNTQWFKNNRILPEALK